jgi:hypothetical protein
MNLQLNAFKSDILTLTLRDIFLLLAGKELKTGSLSVRRGGVK